MPVPFAMMIASSDETFREMVRDNLLNIPDSRVGSEYQEVSPNLYVRVMQDLVDPQIRPWHSTIAKLQVCFRSGTERRPARQPRSVRITRRREAHRIYQRAALHVLLVRRVLPRL